MNPSTPDEMLRLYHLAADLSAQILEQARADEWQQVLDLGSRYIAIIESIKKLGELRPLDARERAAKHELIVAILENDAATRDLAEPSLARLSQLIGTMKRQQALMHAYGPAAVATP